MRWRRFSCWRRPATQMWPASSMSCRSVDDEMMMKMMMMMVSACHSHGERIHGGHRDHACTVYDMYMIEDRPLDEVAALQLLSTPGHPNVASVRDVMQVGQCQRLVVPCQGGSGSEGIHRLWGPQGGDLHGILYLEG
jgi:hypothetical protein